MTLSFLLALVSYVMLTALFNIPKPLEYRTLLKNNKNFFFLPATWLNISISLLSFAICEFCGGLCYRIKTFLKILEAMVIETCTFT